MLGAAAVYVSTAVQSLATGERKDTRLTKVRTGSLDLFTHEKPQKTYGQKVRSIILLIMFGLYPVRTPG